MPSPAYLPDPNKWISTSSSKPKPPQRPLVAFRHGFPTPPTSVARNVRTDGNAASSGQVRQKQATLSGLGLGEPSKRAGSSGVGERGLGMLSPPSTTRERGTRRLGHILDSGGRGSPAPRRKESKLRVRADDYWNSDEDGDGEGLEDEPGPSRTGTAGSSKPVSYLSSRTRPGKVEKKRSPKSTSTSKGKDREDKSAAVLSAFSSGELSDLPPEYMSDYERPSPASRPAARDRADNPNVVLTAAPAPIHPNPRTLAATRAIPSSLTPSTQPRPLAPRHASPRPFSAAPTPASTRAEPTPPEHSPRPLTPVPKNVLAIHRQLCGQDPAQLERVHSPWRRQTSAQRLAREEAWREEDRKMRDERKRDREKTLAAKQDRKAQVDERVRNRSMLLRGSDGVKRTRSLVDWGESEGSSPKRMRAGVPLTQLRPNSLVLTRSPPSKERAERSRALHLDMATSGSGGKQTAPNPSILARSFGENPSADRALDLASKSRPNPLLVDPAVKRDDARPSHAATPRIPPVSSATVAEEPSSSASPSPAPPSDPPHPSSTPKKSPATGHHTVTPPKTTGMRGQAHQETLFAFPPPPQPNFNADPAPPRRAKQDFRPVEMQAETLLTWSLGPGVAGPNSIDEKEVRHDAGQADPEQVEGIAGANEPQRRNPVDVTPDKDAMELREKTQEIPRRYSDSDQSESASVSQAEVQSNLGLTNIAVRAFGLFGVLPAPSIFPDSHPYDIDGTPLAREGCGPHLCGGRDCESVLDDAQAYPFGSHGLGGSTPGYPFRPYLGSPAVPFRLHANGVDYQTAEKNSSRRWFRGDSDTDKAGGIRVLQSAEEADEE